MKLPLKSSLVPLAVAFASLSSAFGQTALSPDRVTFFTEPNYKGESLIIEAGAAVEDLQTLRRNDQRPWIFAISSVKLEGAARATVFSGQGFSGHRLEIGSNVSDLYAVARGNERGLTWDRAIASVRVTGPQRVVVPQPTQPVVVAAPPARQVVVTPAPPPPAVVHMAPGHGAPPPNARPRYDRRTADLLVQRAFREVLNRPADPEGLRTYRDRLMHQGWSEQQVIQQLQRSSEARAINPEAAIRDAYQDVLGRDPDPKGLAHYRAKWRDGWTQGQIRDDLRRSHEGRDNYVRNAVTRAYREILQREPDESGLNFYSQMMRERGWTERDVRQQLAGSDEYRQRAK